MDLIDKINEMAARIPKQIEHISTEEATKNALVMPFINALGFNVFDPTEVVPEFTADVGTKKGEKVDYAIVRDGKPILLFEVKCTGTDLNNVHASQLYRYFSVTEARFGILTDGVIYRFYSDLDAPNKMDEKPFFVFDLTDYNESQVAELKKFTKSSFDVGDILSAASELKYKREIVNLITAEFNDPSEAFVRHFAGQVYSRRFTQTVLAEFKGITQEALRMFVNRKVEDRLKSALAKETVISPEQKTAASPESAAGVSPESVEIAKEKAVTTQDEIDGFYVVKSILREIVDPHRIMMRDLKSYCSILLDDTNRKPVCRLRFNAAQKYIGLFDQDKNEEVVPIDNVDDIFKYADRLKATIVLYEGQ